MSISNSLSSIQTNQSFLNKTASSIANNKSNLAQNMTNLIIADKTNALNITAIKAQNEILGTLLDIKA